ncbi:FBP domain-containing protein [Pseudonocardia parietis]|uniref:Elongation factor G-binding protein C-terminal treble-clef zinc-finger domain-containing protein n=1 Tax=Pseudonocardia parietis TaxID=570936 RepID=A0ABS4VQM4_9PSEU|nr:FBP domain-containing protein [Pseudonocardia parietis]MBP2365889.1 hypothetical protein [Pseudonocardia parietis]
MTSSTEIRIRRSMSNCSRGEAARMTVPTWVRELDPDGLEDVHGWRDPKAPGRGVLLVPTEDGPVGVLLRASAGGTRAAAMCALCRTTHTVGGVALFAAARRGAAGRQGDTVGTYICADLACVQHVGAVPTPAVRPTPGVTVDERRAGLRERAAGFLATVTGSG